MAETDVTLVELTGEALDRELPAGSWLRVVLDVLAERFAEADEVLRRRE